MTKKDAKSKESNIDECFILEGIINITTVLPIHQELLNRVSKADNICIDASKVSKITTPGIQLILSLYNYTRETNKELVIYNPSEAFNTCINELGFAGSEITKNIINR